MGSNPNYPSANSFTNRSRSIWRICALTMSILQSLDNGQPFLGEGELKPQSWAGTCPVFGAGGVAPLPLGTYRIILCTLLTVAYSWADICPVFYYNTHILRTILCMVWFGHQHALVQYLEQAGLPVVYNRLGLTSGAVRQHQNEHVNARRT